MKTVKRLFLYFSIAIAYGTIKAGYFDSWGYWIALSLLISWYIFDVIGEHEND